MSPRLTASIVISALFGVIGVMGIDAYAQAPEACTLGWYITGYYTPMESDFSGKLVKIKADGHNYKFKKDFVNVVKINGWGKTISGSYLGWYGNSFHLSNQGPLDAIGNPLQIGTIATDQAIISFGTLVTIPTLPTPWNAQGFISSDVGPAITGQHIDVYTGEGKAALSEAYRITGHDNTVCVSNP